MPRTGSPSASREPHRQVQDPVLEELLAGDISNPNFSYHGASGVCASSAMSRSGQTSSAVCISVSARPRPRASFGQHHPPDPPGRAVVEHPGVADQPDAVAQQHVPGPGLVVPAVEVGVGTGLLDDEDLLPQPPHLVRRRDVERLERSPRCSLWVHRRNSNVSLCAGAGAPDLPRPLRHACGDDEHARPRVPGGHDRPLRRGRLAGLLAAPGGQRRQRAPQLGRRLLHRLHGVGRRPPDRAVLRIRAHRSSWSSPRVPSRSHRPR